MIQIDMPMPENCSCCRFAYGDYVEGVLTLSCMTPTGRKMYDPDLINRKSRPEWCPLKEQETELEQKLKEQEDAYSELAKEYLSLSNRAAHKPNIVRCKECVHRGNPKKCVLAFVAEKQDFPVFFYDSRGDWFCADGVAKDINVPDKESR